MKTKTIPFDLEMAKKIQAGEIKGRIITDTRTPLHITYWTCGGKNVNFDYILMILTKFCDDYYKEFCREGLQICKEHLFIELPEEAPKPEFKPFDKVLVRDYCNSEWCLALYAYYSRQFKSHRIVGGSCWKQCIPYEGNEHLIGTTNPD